MPPEAVAVIEPEVGAALVGLLNVVPTVTVTPAQGLLAESVTEVLPMHPAEEVAVTV